MTAKEFYETFTNEYQCRDHWRAMREKTGIVCKKCKGLEHYWNHGKNEWRCRKCKSVTTLKTGTVMMHSNLSILTWYKAIFEVMHRNKGISATQLYKQFPEIKGEGTAWYLLHKIRRAMGMRDEKYVIEGNAEIDDAFVTVVKEIQPEPDESKRGRGSMRKAAILVLASYSKIPSKKRKKNRPSTNPGYFKVFHMESLDKLTINDTVFRYMKATCRLKTDGYKGYNDLGEFMKKHTAKITPPERGHIELPWSHCAIGNLKRGLDGIYHHVSEANLQNYLDEFVFKLNRRRAESPFLRLLNACLNVAWG
jgi:hypothetical protein